MSEKKEIKRKEKELNLLKTNFSEKNFLTFEKDLLSIHFLLPLPSCIEREIVMGGRKEEEGKREGEREGGRKKVREKEEKEHSFFILFLAYEAFFFTFCSHSLPFKRERESEEKIREKTFKKRGEGERECKRRERESREGGE